MYNYIMERKVRSFLVLQFILFTLDGGMGVLRYYMGVSAHGRDYSPSMDTVYTMVMYVGGYLVLRALWRRVRR